MTQAIHHLRHTFRALRHRDFRLFWIGQWVSVTGTWIQTMALSWLLYRLSASPFLLGVLAMSRFGPTLVGAPFAGVLADRLPRRKVVIATQASSLILAATLAVLTLSRLIQESHILILAFLQGIVDVVDMTTRQTLQTDLVGSEDLPSAVALNSAAFNAGRLVGPALAGPVVAAWGEGICFSLNAASYIAVLIGLLLIRTEPSPSHRTHSMRSEIGEGLDYAWRHTGLRAMLSILGLMSMLGLSAYTLLPVFARDILHAGPQGYGLLLAGTGVGAIAGALFAAGRRKSSESSAYRFNLGVMAVLGTGLWGLGLSQSTWASVCIMVVLGASLAVGMATTNAFVQTEAPPQLRGRLVSIYVWVFGGLTPIGGLIAGALAERTGVDITARICGAACLTAAALGLLKSGGSRPSHFQESQ